MMNIYIRVRLNTSEIVQTNCIEYSYTLSRSYLIVRGLLYQYLKSIERFSYA